MLISWVKRHYLALYSVFIIFLFLLNVVSFAKSGNNLIYKSYQITSNDISSYPHFVWHNKDYAIGTVVLIVGSFFVDKSFKAYALDHQNNTATNLSNIVKPFGNGYAMFPAVSILALFGYLSDNTKFMDASLTSLESGAVAGIITLGLKSIVGRKRPLATSSNLTFRPFDINNTYASFPSGDATIAWSMITPYAVYYHQPLLYIVPTLVDLERIYKNEHWTSDVIAGSVIGFSIGYLFSENHLRLSKTVSLQTDGRDIVFNVKF